MCLYRAQLHHSRYTYCLLYGMCPLGNTLPHHCVIDFIQKAACWDSICCLYRSLVELWCFRNHVRVLTFGITASQLDTMIQCSMWCWQPEPKDCLLLCNVSTVATYTSSSHIVLYWWDSHIMMQAGIPADHHRTVVWDSICRHYTGCSDSCWQKANRVVGEVSTFKCVFLRNMLNIQHWLQLQLT